MTTTGQNFLFDISNLQCLIAARHLSSGWQCIVFEDMHAFVDYMSDKYDFEFETGDRCYWESLWDELPDELDKLLDKHVVVSGWSFHGKDFEFSKDHYDLNEFEILRKKFVCENVCENYAQFGNILAMEEIIENKDVRYQSILCKALMTMLEEGIDFEYKSEKYIEVQ